MSSQYGSGLDVATRAVQEIRTRAEFAKALRGLKDGLRLSLRDIARKGKIAPATVSSIIEGVRPPMQNKVDGFLIGCGVQTAERQIWLAKYQELYPTASAVRSTMHPQMKMRRPGGWTMIGADASDARSHFATRGRGHRTAGNSQDLFRGRVAAVATVQAWLAAETSPGRPMVIIGQPGAGKSAVLARVALMMERNATSVGVAVHARDATLSDVVGAVAVTASMPPTTTTNDLLDTLSARSGEGPLVVAVDALDEVYSVSDRKQIAEFLVALSRLPNLRVVVATRPLASLNPYAMDSLPVMLGAVTPQSKNIVDLDSNEYFEPEGLRAFVAAVLTQAGPAGTACSLYRSDEQLTDRLATEVAARAGRNHLVAALAATYLSALDTVTDPREPSFDPRQIPATVGEAISKYLDTLTDDKRTLIQGLLTALTYARGEGVDDRRWITFANALGYDVTQMQIDLLRQSHAIDYLLHTARSGHGRVTRLFHLALVEELQQRRGDTRADEKALLKSMLDTASKAWPHADAYIRDHAAEHADAADDLITLIHDFGFLAIADVERLLPLLPSGRQALNLPIIPVLRQAGRFLRSLPERRRLPLLSLTAAHLGFDDLRARLNTVADTSFAVSWAHRIQQPHQRVVTRGPVTSVAVGSLDGRDVIASAGDDGTISLWDHIGWPAGAPLTGHTGPINAVLIAQLDGRDCIISAGYDQTVRIWDSAGQPLTPPLIGHTDTVSAIAAGNLDGRSVIASASHDGTIRLWDAGGRQLAAPFAGHDGWIYAVAIGRLADRDVVVSGGADTKVKVWDSAGRLVRELTDFSGSITTLTLAPISGSNCIVAGGTELSRHRGPDAVIRIWDSDGRLVQEPLVRPDTWAFSITVTQLGEKKVIACATYEDSLNIWSSPPGAAPLVGHRGPVWSVTSGQLLNRDVIVSGGSDRTIRIWDSAERPDDDHTPMRSTVTALASGRIGGRDVIVSGGRGSVKFWTSGGSLIQELQTETGVMAVAKIGKRNLIICSSRDDGNPLRLWSLSGKHVGVLKGDYGTPRALAAGRLGALDVIVSASDDEVWLQDTEGRFIRELAGHAGAVLTLTIGRLGNEDVIVSAGEDGDVRIWDSSGHPVGVPLTGHTGTVAAVAIGRLGRTDVIASCGSDGTVRVWERFGKQARPPFTGHNAAVNGLAFGKIDGRDVLVSASSDETVRVWGADLQANDDGVLDVLGEARAVTILSDGRVCAATDLGLCFWEFLGIRGHKAPPLPRQPVFDGPPTLPFA